MSLSGVTQLPLAKVTTEATLLGATRDILVASGLWELSHESLGKALTLGSDSTGSDGWFWVGGGIIVCVERHSRGNMGSLSEQVQ